MTLQYILSDMLNIRWFSGLIAAIIFLCVGLNAHSEECCQGGFWTTDYPAALKRAAAENKHVLLDFTGSDWCRNCGWLDHEVFQQPEFKAYAEANLICVRVDFPKETPQPEELKKANRALQEKYDIHGLPAVLILTPQEKIVKRTGYKRGGAAHYVEMLKEAIAAGPAE